LLYSFMLGTKLPENLMQRLNPSWQQKIL